MITVLIIGGGLALILLIVGVVAEASGERALVDERLSKFLEDEGTAKLPKESKGALTLSLIHI